MITTATMSSSSLSSPNNSPTGNGLSAHLDSQIARLNAQIATFRQEKQSVSTAILASSTVRNIVQSRQSTQNDIRDSEENNTYRRLEEAVTKQQARMDITVQRLMNNVTGFPFTDPAPDRICNGEGSMLGLRFEMPRIPTNRGSSTETVNVFLIVLRHIQSGGKTYLHFQPEMNQIPKHIDVEGFAARCLPVPDTDDNNNRRSPSVPRNESFQDDSGIDVTQDLTHLMNGNGTNGHAASTTNPLSTQNQNPTIDMSNTNQSLPLFVSTTRNALLSWHYRTSHIHYLINSLTLPSPSTSIPPIYKYAIATLQPNPPATQLTIDWINGTTALLAINKNGLVGIARVFGPRIDHGDEEIDRDDGTFRCHGVERRLEGVRLAELAGRLEEVGSLMGGDT